jgi:tRNA G18 (ribose-2'-O)-methylase SpoU
MEKLKIEELNRVSPETYAKIPKLRLTVVLDNVRSLNNIGSVFRTSDAFLVEKICLCGISATPPSTEIHKTALGAENTVEWAYFEDTLEAVKELKKENYTVFAVEQTRNSLSPGQLKLDKSGRYALVLGNEVKGVQQCVVDACDGSIEIPQFGTKHSLNVSVAAGIVIWLFFSALCGGD